MTVAFRSIGALNAGTTSCTPPLPAGFQPTDVFIAALFNRGGGAGSISTPAGWFKINGSAAAGQSALYYRAAQAGDTAPTFSSAGAVETGGWIAAFIGVQRASPVHWQAFDQSSVCSAFDVPPLTISQPNTLVLSLARRSLPSGWAGGTVTPLVPPGFTAIATRPNSAAFGNVVGFAYQVQTTPKSYAADEAEWGLSPIPGGSSCSCAAASLLAATGVTVARTPLTGPLGLGHLS